MSLITPAFGLFFWMTVVFLIVLVILKKWGFPVIVNMVKNTSCLYIVGGADLLSLTYSFVTGENTGGSYAPAYIVCGVIFFLICFPLSSFASMWETSLKKREQKMFRSEIAKEA